jgi:uncharacterized protein YjiS (DUF1127 family)
MADFTANTVGTTVPGNLISRVFKKVWDVLIYIGENNSRAQTIQALMQLSDAELEARGLTRHEIVQRVFADGRYL